MAQVVKMKKKLNQYEIPLESASSPGTTLTIRKLQMSEDTIELKFDTLPSDTKDAQHQQKTAQFFLSNKEMQNIQLALLSLNTNNGDELARIELEKPLQEVGNFSWWAKKCLLRYATTGTLHQVFQVAHAVMIFESLWDHCANQNQNWLWDTARSGLYILEEINRTTDPGGNAELDDELLAITLSIKEYFRINHCFDPYTGISEAGKTWVTPQHSPRHYLDELNTTHKRIYD
jgi:hypothetical protein